MFDTVKIIKDDAERVAKYVFTKENAVAESVLYRYPDFKTRTVICCSTQSGCPVGCRFCGAGDFFARNLTADEIVSQPERLLQDVDCRPDEMGRLQIMFMSMGEPLLNLRELVPALRTLKAKYPKAALLISTVGPDIDYSPVNDVSKEIETIGLQFSVHESTDKARDQLIPFKKKLTLAQIAEKGLAWFKLTGRKPFFNYCAHDDNSSEIDAARLFGLYPPEYWSATVSVVCERSDGLAATNEHQRKLATDFGDKLLALGFDVRVFDPAGQDTIGGGCGQLWFVQDWVKNNPNKFKPSCGAKLPAIHAPTGFQVVDAGRDDYSAGLSERVQG
jgi:23S rRNA (adenine2503-C2)-methyltransferase